ncbi:unnamed protein product [Adineta ricciae]|uniref:Uncharacterized protein n=1 Tax=Adineta ricciae TaxID=249248 RepID=A0A814JBM2_ADIRI|nr:unnamed protein product [Adineta ricciae]
MNDPGRVFATIDSGIYADTGSYKQNRQPNRFISAQWIYPTLTSIPDPINYCLNGIRMQLEINGYVDRTMTTMEFKPVSIVNGDFN